MKIHSDAYELIREERIEDVHADAALLRHKKSGARIALLSNDDENKVFNIAFRTPPANSTGVAHIIEHTVLCGSRKFPLKDPFVELVKGSMNTFLNAMTYPDKTMFPVASCNDTDFQNLMDVYLDAVFYPNIYREEKIFRQEGWHYELENKDDPITYNGVVYNEMKGAFSSAEDVLDRTVFNALFPDTAYGVESGGDPEYIPELTYEEFLDFHRKYYHPSNSYIYLYGNMDMDEKLAWLDREYLSKFDAIPVDSGIAFQKPFSAPKVKADFYPVLDEDPLQHNTYLSENMVVGDALDLTLNVAFSILEYVLLDAPGAPVKQALLDAGIGKDIEGSYNDGILQPFFTIEAKNADAGDQERFLSLIRGTLSRIAEEGIDQKALASGINYYEFRFREADYASYPKGLIYGIGMFNSWLYDENEPFLYLKQLGVFEELKRKSGEGYFEELIRKYLLDNPHSVLVVLEPKRGLQAEKEARTAEKLAAYKASLSDAEIEKLVADTKALKEYQESEDSEEALESIPLLKVSDVDRKTPVTLSINERDVGGSTVLWHNYQTNGIGYLTILFDAERVPDELIPYLGLLRSVLGYVNTEHYTYGELFHEINANTGGIGCGLNVMPGKKADMGVYRKFGVQAKYLYPKQDFVFRMIREILLTSDLGDRKRLHEIIASQTARLQSSIPASGHASAVRRAESYLSPMAAWQEKTGGIEYLHFIEEIESHFDEKADEVIGNLRELCRCLFRPENLFVSLTAEKEGYEGLEEQIRVLKADLFRESAPEGKFDWKPEAKNEGFCTSGQVQYVASAGNFRKAGYEYTGALRILHTILNYEYLWINLRVKGGAYGCMSSFQRTGNSYLVSYRDPHLAETYEVYRKLPEFVRTFRADARTMNKYIIGTISELDTPMTPSARGSVAMSCYFTGLREEDFQKEREQILDADVDSIRALAPLTEAVAACDNICVIGSEAAVDGASDLFRSVEPLIQST